jgi:hypothetical protein
MILLDVPWWHLMTVVKESDRETSLWHSNHQGTWCSLMILDNNTWWQLSRSVTACWSLDLDFSHQLDWTDECVTRHITVTTIKRVVLWARIIQSVVCLPDMDLSIVVHINNRHPHQCVCVSVKTWWSNLSREHTQAHTHTDTCRTTSCSNALVVVWTHTSIHTHTHSHCVCVCEDGVYTCTCNPSFVAHTHTHIDLWLHSLHCAVLSVWQDDDPTRRLFYTTQSLIWLW